MKQNHLRILSGLLGILSVVGLFSSGSLISEEKVTVKNLNQTKNQVALIKSLEYETVKTYNSSLPTGTVVTKEEGHAGLAYVNEDNETLEIVESPKNEELEIGTGENAVYVGKMTGYGPDCVGCSGSGGLACPTSHNLVRDGEYYNDSTYGSVRIIAAALDKFPCGTIIKVEGSNLGTFNAIVLDTGGAMRRAWNNGIVHMDLAYKSENDQAIHLATGSNIKYSVQRWGY